ncbi:MAG: NAD(P)H-binding protein [bacterium]
MILVTGATGHTGSRLVRRLLEGKHQVRAFVRTKERASFLPGRGEEIFNGDLENPDDLKRALEGVRAVYNIAHIRFADNVCAACEAAGVRRAIFMSSTRKFTRFPCVSSRQVEDGEQRIMASGLDYTIIRPSMIYGGERDNNMTKLVAVLRRWPVFPLFGGGANLVQPIFVWDLVHILASCLDHSKMIRSDFTVAGPKAITYREMVATICRVMGRRRLLVPLPMGLGLGAAWLYEKLSSRPRVTVEQVRRLQEDKAFDISPIKKALDFVPISFEEGIRRKLSGAV